MQRPFFFLPAYILMSIVASSYFANQSAYACQCSPGGADRLYEDSDVIFSGTVSKVDEVYSFLENEQYVSFVNITSWKGVDTESVTVRAEQWCGVNRFNEGAEYLVYADKGPVSIDAKACSGTVPLENAGYRSQFLAAKPIIPLKDGDTGSISLPFTVFGIGLSAAGLAGFLSLRRLRKNRH